MANALPIPHPWTIDEPGPEWRRILAGGRQETSTLAYGAINDFRRCIECRWGFFMNAHHRAHAADEVVCPREGCGKVQLRGLAS